MDRKKRILVVDDEPDLCEILKFNLQAAGYEVSVAHSAREALAQDLGQTDLLLLDVMMPGMSGFALAQQLKGQPETAGLPIIFLTARDTERDTLHGFSIGADDYISKPFSVKEVQARVKAVLHRTGNHEASQADVISYEGLTIHLGRKCVEVDGEEVGFTRTEFELLNLLLSHRGEVFSRQQLIENIWPHDVVVTGRTVDVNITRMRKKIGRYARCIATRIGYGYYFDV
ncbi:MAG: response regulator transcription factor [Bacteroidaceae bacterium]|nr:response regulator transcription factor [Bacteroidaceae bacterium]MDO4995131.1 response regulator transcription factor [Bacteroidales bacterium]